MHLPRAPACEDASQPLLLGASASLALRPRASLLDALSRRLLSVDRFRALRHFSSADRATGKARTNEAEEGASHAGTPVERTFHTSGPITQANYFVDPLTWGDELLQTVARGEYGVVHGPPQSGKTTRILALCEWLDRNGYLPI